MNARHFRLKKDLTEATALRRADRIGAIAVGHQADLLLLDVANIDAWLYRVGVNAVRGAFKRGRQVSPVPHSA